MFVADQPGTLLALDPATGATLWTFKPETPFSGKRGVGIGEGLLFAGLRDSNVMAISQETGKLVWTYVHGPEVPSQGMAPLPPTATAWSSASCRSATTSCAAARSASTRRPASSSGASTSCPGPASRATRPGRRTATSGSTAAARCGRRRRSMRSSGLVYLETGNAVPQCGGELRPGNNLFDNSVVALDFKTGKMRWYFSSSSITTSGSTTSARRSCCTTRRSAASRARRSRRCGPTASSFILDRETGKPIAAGRGAAGEAGRVPEDVADAAVHGRRRSGRARSAWTRT